MGQLAMINRGFFGMYTKPYGLYKLEALMGENLEKTQSFSDTYAKITALHGVVSGLLKGKAHQPLRKLNKSLAKSMDIA